MTRLIYLFAIFVAVHGCDVCEEESRNNNCHESMKDAFSQLISGDSNLGTLLADPIPIDYFEGSFSTLRYKNYNSTMAGIRSCNVTKFIISEDGKMFDSELKCSKLLLCSSNQVNGYVLHEAFYGNGEVEIEYNNYNIAVYAQLKYIREADDKVYFDVGKYTADVSIDGPIKYTFRNLYYGDVAKNEAISKYATENWKACAIFARDPVFYAILDNVFNSFNKYLKSAPVDEIFKC